MYAIRTQPWGAIDIVEFEPIETDGSWIHSERESHHTDDCFSTFEDAKLPAVLRARELVAHQQRRLDAAQVALEKILTSTGPTR